MALNFKDVTTFDEHPIETLRENGDKAVARLEKRRRIIRRDQIYENATKSIFFLSIFSCILWNEVVSLSSTSNPILYRSWRFTKSPSLFIHYTSNSATRLRTRQEWRPFCETQRNYKRNDSCIEEEDQIEKKSRLLKQAKTIIKKREEYLILETSNMLPSWLCHYETRSKKNNRHSRNPSNSHINETSEQVALRKLIALKSSLLHKDQLHHDDRTSFMTKTSFTSQEVEDILDAVLLASRKNWNKIAAACDFLLLLLQIKRKEEERIGKIRRRTTYFSSSSDNTSMPNEKEDIKYDFDDKLDENNIISRDTLIASAFHFCDCVSARESGIYSVIKRAVKSKSSTTLLHSNGISTITEKQNIENGYTPSSVLLPFSSDLRANDYDDLNQQDTFTHTHTSNYEQDILWNKDERNDIPINTYDSSESSNNAMAAPVLSSNDFGIGIEEFGKEPMKIALEAARIKRAEVMSDSVVGRRKTNMSNRKLLPLENSKQETQQSLRDLLLTISDDWRALVIRSAASLYRLKGIQQNQQTLIQNQYLRQLPSRMSSKNSILKDFIYKQQRVSLSPDEVKVAKEALSIYAPLAQRLGLQRLKSDLESLSFQLLYPRQYSSALRLYHSTPILKNIQTKETVLGAKQMNMVADFIACKLEDIFSNDQVLMNQLESVEVTSRVKEPFSLWKKMLKLRFKEVRSKMNQSESPLITAVHVDKESDDNSVPPNKLSLSRNPECTSAVKDIEPLTSSSPSIMDVPDTIALRVILHPNDTQQDDKETLQTRERLLCYYVQQLCSNLWPPSDVNRIKDYLQYPKQNGYQSLHYTSGIFLYGEYWPFELQIRSQNMHVAAEFGLAAHWDYKLQNPTPSQENTNNSSEQIQIKPLLISQKDSGVDLIANCSSLEENSPMEAPSAAIDAETVFVTKCTKFRTSLAHSSKSTEGNILNNTGELKGNENFLESSMIKTQKSTQTLTSAGSTYIEALSIARADIVQKNIFLFVSPTTSKFEGNIIPLQPGSLVVDALKECELRYNKPIVRKVKANAGKCTTESDSFYLNGRLTTLDQSLTNGDVLTLQI